MTTEKDRDNLIYAIIVRCYEQEQNIRNSLDSKAYNIIGISGILSAFIIAVTTAFYSQTHYQLIFLLPFIPLLSSAILGLFAYQIKCYNAIDPQRFINEYKDKDYETTLRRYIGTIAKTTNDNGCVHKRKAKLIKYALWSLVIATTLFFVTIFVTWLI